MVGILVCLVLLSLLGTAAAKENFYGVVKQMPQEGDVGRWQVENQAVYVVPESKGDDKYAKPVAGGQVKVEGVKVEGKLIVYEMEAVSPPK